MTAIDGQNSFSNSATGPTPGYPRTAASVNTAVQTPMNNAWALANGYARKTVANLLIAQTTEVETEYLFGTAGGSSDTLAQTFQFKPVAINHYWKHVYLERITQGTVLTFQGGAPYATFLTWTAPADMSDVWLEFNHSSSTGTWNFCGVQWTRGNMLEMIVLVGGTKSVTTTPREIHYRGSSLTAMTLTHNLDLDGDYNDGDRLTVFVNGLIPLASFAVRDSSDVVLAQVAPARDGPDAKIELKHIAGAWELLGIFRSTRLFQNEPALVFRSLTAGFQTLDLAYEHHCFGGIAANMTITVPDGTWIGQQVHCYFDTIGSGVTLGISFRGPAVSSTMAKTGSANYQHWGAIWDGSRWRVTHNFE